MILINFYRRIFMLNFIQNNWKDLLEIIISLILGFLGGYTFNNMKSKNISKINGNNNNVIQKGNNLYADKK